MDGPMDQAPQGARTSRMTADLVLTRGRCRELKEAMPNLFPNLPISMPPAYRASNWRTSPAAMWLARLAIEEEASAREHAERREARKRGVVRFEIDALYSDAGSPTWLVTESMTEIGAAWALFDKSLALCRMISETHCEAALLPLSPRPLRLTDGNREVAVYVPREISGDLFIKVGGRSGYSSLPFGVFGSACGKTARAGIEAAKSKLEMPASPMLSAESVEGVALWSKAMSVMADHLIASWDDLPVRMTEADLASVRPFDPPASPEKTPVQPVPAPKPGPALHRFERVHLETVYWKDRSGAENKPAKGFPCQNGSTSINENTDHRQPVVTLSAHEADDDLMIQIAPASAWIARRGGSVATTIEPDGQIHLEGVDATGILNLADVSRKGVVSRTFPDGRRVVIFPNGTVHVDVAGGTTMKIEPNGLVYEVDSEDLDQGN